MTDDPYLDTIIALVLVYALLSILVSILLETWNEYTKERGVFLQRVILRLLNDPLNKNYGYLIYQHPIIDKMRKDGNSYPHYIPAEGFANALVDTLADEAVVMRYERTEAGRTIAIREGAELPLDKRLIRGVDRMADSELKRLLRNFLDRNMKRYTPAPGARSVRRLDMDTLKSELGRWFDDFMDRAAGEYKDRQRGKLKLLGFVVALLLNADSVHMARVFFLDKDLRERMVERAEVAGEAVRTSTDTTEAGLRIAVLRKLTAMDTAQWRNARKDTVLLRSLAKALDARGLQRQRQQADSLLALVERWQLPLGWSGSEAPLSWKGRSWKANAARPAHTEPLLSYHQERNHGSWPDLFLWAVGVWATAWALSFGAPFWFEALVKLINVRRSGLKPKTMAERPN